MSSIVKKMLSPQILIQLNASPASKAEAIEQAGAMLTAAGCVASGYPASMAKREAVANTFLGQGVAIPHGQGEDRALVLTGGIAVLQVPGGVEWNPGQTAHLVVAIAAQSDSHLALLRRLTRLLQNETRLTRLFITDSGEDIRAALTEDGAAETSAPAEDFAQRFEWTVEYPAGLHARPASRWVETARRYGASVRVRHETETADAKALVGLLQLGLAQGAVITVSAQGGDAEAALKALKTTMNGLVAEEVQIAALAAERAAQPVSGWTPPTPLVAIRGVAASPGLGIGRVRLVRASALDIEDNPVSLAEGGTLLEEALNATRAQLKALADDTARRVGASEAGIFRAQSELLGDTDLITKACQYMVEGHGPAWSWHAAIEELATQLSTQGNAMLAARAADLRDVGGRVLTVLDPSLKREEIAIAADEAVVLVAEDLSPSDTAALDVSKVAALVTALGGPTSHTAILARTIGLPALVAAGNAVLNLKDGDTVIVDGQGGQLFLSPADEDLIAARAWIGEQQVIRDKENQTRALPARTEDGHSVDVAANINQAHQAAFALEQGAEGVGLMRTEFLFLEGGKTPDEDEQYEAYAAMLKSMEGRPVIVRALDIGGDKQVPHLNLPQEMNPFLGVRGARLLLRRPELMEPQIRALYRAAKDAKGQLSIMFPMITSLSEIKAVRHVCDRIRTELNAPSVSLGIMIEVPAAAIMAEMLAPHVDFFSIGTNDLTQYTLAIDRQNPDLAPEADAMHPAVLRLIKKTVDGANAAGRWVGVCGGLAGDPFGASLLTGLGVKELSMTPREIPSVKARIRKAKLSELQALAEKALSRATPAEVHALEGK